MSEFSPELAALINARVESHRLREPVFSPFRLDSSSLLPEEMEDSFANDFILGRWEIRSCHYAPTMNEYAIRQLRHGKSSCLTLSGLSVHRAQWLAPSSLVSHSIPLRGSSQYFSHNRDNFMIAV